MGHHKKFVPIDYKTPKPPDRRRREYRHLMPHDTPPQPEPIKLTPMRLKGLRLLDTHHQSGRCYWCCNPIQNIYFEIDHLMPRVFNGSDDDSNLRTVCERCNSLKSNSLPMDFALYLLGAPIFKRGIAGKSYDIPIEVKPYKTTAERIWEYNYKPEKYDRPRTYAPTAYALMKQEMKKKHNNIN